MADATTTNTDNGTTTYQTPQFDASVPAAPVYHPTTLAANPYQQGTAQSNVYNDYISNLGRAPENAGVINQWASQPQSVYDQGIANSNEAQTYGRARNEINPAVDAQIQQYYNQIGTQSQATQQQLQALGQNYNQQFGSLGFGHSQQMNAIANQIAAIQQNTNYSAQQLQNKFQPAYLNAINMANRHGLLDSSVSLGNIGMAFLPINQGLSNLYNTQEQQLNAAAQNRQSVEQKYQFDYGGLISKQQQEAQQLRDQLSLYTKQQQDLASQQENTRGAQIAARAGSLSDLQKEFGLQQQQVQGYLQNLLAQQNIAERGQDISYKSALLPYQMAPKK